MRAHLRARGTSLPPPGGESTEGTAGRRRESAVTSRGGRRWRFVALLAPAVEHIDAVIDAHPNHDRDGEKIGEIKLPSEPAHSFEQPRAAEDQGDSRQQGIAQIAEIGEDENEDSYQCEERGPFV